MLVTQMDAPLLGRRFKYDVSCVNPNMDKTALLSQQRVREKFERGVYQSEDAPCFCGSSDSYFLAERDWYGNYYPFVLCKACGIARKNPRWSEASYVDFYSKEYRLLYGDSVRTKEELFHGRVKEAMHVADYVKGSISLARHAMVFEVGCNMGALLVPFAEHGCEVLGVDYDMEYLEYGKKKTGLPLMCGGIEKLAECGKQADLILLNHVFEHLLDLDKEILKLKSVLKAGGYLYVGVPGTFSWIDAECGGDIMGLLQNAHVWQFTLEALRYVLECHGFEFAAGDERILAVFKKTDAVFRKKGDVPAGHSEKVLSYLLHRERTFFPKRLLKKYFSPVLRLRRAFSS